jgi:hypothetical protein
VLVVLVCVTWGWCTHVMVQDAMGRVMFLVASACLSGVWDCAVVLVCDCVRLACVCVCVDV